MTKYQLNVIWRLTLTFLFCTWFAVLAGKDGVDVYPRISQGPATVRMRATVEPDAANRRLCWGYDGPKYRETCEDLDGDRAARTRTVYWPDLPGGRYVGFVAVWKVGQKSPQMWTQPFCIVGSVRDEAVSCSDASPE